MDKLASIETFVTVADCRSFSAAAERLRLSKAMVSKQVQALEQQLGTRLFARTTRHLRLTDAGAAYLAGCRRLLTELAETFPHRIVLGLDARDGRVAVRGWIDTSPLTAIDVARRHAALPLAAIVYTDIATDGMLSGPNLTALREMLAASHHPLVASGGVATATDIEQVTATGCAGCIVGRALYEGAVTIPAALTAAGDVA